MVDYKEMYHTLFRASEEAINLLIQAQRKCEEMYLSAPDTEISVLPPAVPAKQQKDRDLKP